MGVVVDVQLPPGVDPVQFRESLPLPVNADLLKEIRLRVNNLPDLMDVEKRWLDDSCLERYIRARKMNVDKAFAMLLETLHWRKEFDVYGLMTGNLESVMKESTTGKLYVHGHDKAGRSILVMKNRNQNSSDTKANIRHLVYNLERAISNNVYPQEKILVLNDLKGYNLKNSPKTKTSLETLHILQNHYPERLYRVIMIDSPSLFHTLYKFIKPFMDPVTANKLSFVNSKDKEAKSMFDELVAENSRQVEYGGTDTWQYSNDLYFKERCIPKYIG